MITGLGIVSPIGIGIDEFWRNALAGKSGIGAPTLFDASRLSPECRIVGEVKHFNALDWMPHRTVQMAGRFSQFAVAVARMAAEDADLEHAKIPSVEIVVSFGSGLSGYVDLGEQGVRAVLNKQSPVPWSVLEYPGHAATSHVAIAVGAKGQAATIETACAAGVDAVAWAADKISRGEALAVVAGSTEAPLSEVSIEAFRALGVLSRWDGHPSQASRPFDKLRTGLVLAEGAAAVIVEEEEHARARGARIYGRISGWGSVTEGAHMRKVDATGTPVARVLDQAMQLAGIGPSDIDYLCAHGNGLPDYDDAETAGIKRAFGQRAWSLPISSIKSMCGQPMSAAGAMQIVTACLALRDGMVPPTINYCVPDPNCDLDYVPNVARMVRIRNVLVHAHGIGGSHAALTLNHVD